MRAIAFVLASLAALGCSGTSAPEPRRTAEPAPEPSAPPPPEEPGEEPPDEEPAPDATPGRYRELAAFRTRICGLRESGQIHCWSADHEIAAAPGTFEHLGRNGANVCGIREDGSIGCPPDPPMPPGGMSGPMGVPPGGPFAELAGADNFRCGLERAGAIRCRGNALLVPRPPEGRFVSITATDATVCGLTRSGEVRCATADGPEVQLPGGPYAFIAAGAHAVCGLRRSDGGVECSRLAPGVETDATGFAQLAIGVAHRCGVARGRVRCWGLMPEPSRYPPPDVEAREVAVGGATCILREDGTVGCWGDEVPTLAMP